MAERSWRRLMAVAFLAGALLLTGCASQKREQERADNLADLIAWFPGRYDNVAQVEHDAKAGVHPVHEKISIIIVRTNTPRLGHHVFYAQEMAADDPRRVMSQRMFAFDIDEERGIVGVMYNFVDPLRWRDGQQNPSLFTVVMQDDVAPVGCELIWKRSGEQFLASHDPKHCHSAGAAAQSGPEATLTPDALTLAGFEFRKSTH